MDGIGISRRASCERRIKPPPRRLRTSSRFQNDNLTRRRQRIHAPKPLDIDEHYTDTGGSSDHVFGLFALLGRRFAPRLRNLKDRKFHAFEKPDAYPALKAHLGPRINIDLIRDNWDELLRMAASMNERIVAPSTILKKRFRIEGAQRTGASPA